MFGHKRGRASACGAPLPGGGACRRRAAAPGRCGIDHTRPAPPPPPTGAPAPPAAAAAADPLDDITDRDYRLFAELGYDVGDVHALVDRFGIKGARWVGQYRVPAAVAVQYHPDFNGRVVGVMWERGLDWDMADRYPDRFDGAGIIEMFRHGVTPGDAGRYDARWNGAEVAELHWGGVDAFESYKWPRTWSAERCVRAYANGYLTPL